MLVRARRFLSLVAAAPIAAAFVACGSSGDPGESADAGDLPASGDASVQADTSRPAPHDGGGADADGADAGDASDASDAGDAASDASDASFTADASDPDASAPTRATHLLAVGNLHTCAVRPGGTVKCWGADADKQLGPAGNGSPSTTPLDVGLADVVEVAAGYAHSCARLSNGHVWCWGEGTGGQLGDGLKADSRTPVEVSGLTDAVAIESNWAHTCALRATGAVTCWGNGGRIGDGTSSAMVTPKEPPGVAGVTDFTTGWGHTCVVLAGGTAKCWGTYNAWGQLGDGDTKDRLSPVDVSGLVGAATIASGSYHVCALLVGGTATCWGNAQSGAIGTGVIGDAPHPVPEAVPNLGNIVELDAKGSNTCARVATGEVYCWGTGPVGDGSTGTKPSPTLVPSLGQDTAELAVGNNHHCARLVGGEIRCWGNNSYRQLSDGSTTKRDVPVTVQGL